MIALITAAVIAFLIAVFGTPLLIAYLRAHEIGQPIHDDVRHHATKAGTPTMGGLVAPIALVVSYPVALVASGRPFTVTGAAGHGSSRGGSPIGSPSRKVRRRGNLERV